VVYEAAATCMPVLASNSGFRELLPPELRFERHDHEELAEKLRQLRDADRGALGRTLRTVVEERHSVEHWADEVAAVAGQGSFSLCRKWRGSSAPRRPPPPPLPCRHPAAR